MFIIVGLGNPGEEYENTRHNTGRMFAEHFIKTHNFSELKEDKKLKAITSTGEIKKEKIIFVLPETFMNKSGISVKPLITSTKKAEALIVAHDDIDLPLGTLKITFGRGSGGHKGIESIMRAIKTKDFVRIRIGVAPTTPSGKIKKPKGERAIVDFIIGAFKPKELEVIKKTITKACHAVETIVADGRATAMNQFN